MPFAKSIGRLLLASLVPITELYQQIREYVIKATDG